MSFLKICGAVVVLTGTVLLTSCATEPFAKVPFDVTLSAPNDVSIDAEPSDLAAGDFNGDGIVDLVSLHFTQNGISFHQGDGLGGFTPRGLIVLGRRPVIHKLLDYNGDGLQDMLVLLDATKEVVLVAGDSDSGIRIEWRLSLVHQEPDADQNAAAPATTERRFDVEHGGFGEDGDVFYMDAGDVNGDGELDLVVTYEGGGFEIWLGDSNGEFEAGEGYETDIQLPRVLLLDADNDGLDDVFLFGNSLSVAEEGEIDGNQTDYFHNNGNGFDEAETVFRNFMGVAYQIMAHDLDNDGHQDIVLNYLGGSMVSVLRGLGNGGFEPAINYLVNQADDVVFADLDMDGDDEMITSRSRGQFQEGFISVFLNAGDMRLRAPENFNVNIGPRSLASGDFNSDGLPDIAVINVFSGDISVLFNETEIALP